MAYSTQKEFFHVPFMNETVDYECLKACVKLKTYQSTIDDRSWAMDESLQSRFLSDLITCQTPVCQISNKISQHNRNKQSSSTIAIHFCRYFYIHVITVFLINLLYRSPK
uniref:Uncharacterized protein n=1 Tax=Ceratitis capitata TaxID=7213 RepID=W8AJK4_CERCA